MRVFRVLSVLVVLVWVTLPKYVDGTSTVLEAFGEKAMQVPIRYLDNAENLHYLTHLSAACKESCENEINDMITNSGWSNGLSALY